MKFDGAELAELEDALCDALVDDVGVSAMLTRGFGAGMASHSTGMPYRERIHHVIRALGACCTR